MNVTELRDRVLNAFEKAESGDMDVEQARAMSSLAGKAISSSATQIKYNAMRGDRNKEIKFLNGN